MIPPQLRDILYIVAAVLFIFDLKWMAHPRTAVRGNAVGALAMGLAVVVTLLSEPMSWPYILGGVAVGGAIGGLAALRRHVAGDDPARRLPRGNGMDGQSHEVRVLADDRLDQLLRPVKPVVALRDGLACDEEE